MDLTEPAVRTSGGQVRGRTEDDIAIFRRTPFARPPVGGLRLAAPYPARAYLLIWDQHHFGVRDLTPALT